MSAIFHRTSIRKFTEQPVEDSKTELLLRAAMAAPSAKNQQPWEYFVVTDKQTISELGESTPNASCAKGAPLVFAACYRKQCLLPNYAHIDMSASVENLLLEADELGLGAVWLGIAPIGERMEKIGEILRLPEHLTAFALIACGYPAEEKAQQDRFDRNRVHFIK